MSKKIIQLPPNRSRKLVLSDGIRRGGPHQKPFKAERQLIRKNLKQEPEQ